MGTAIRDRGDSSTGQSPERRALKVDVVGRQPGATYKVLGRDEPQPGLVRIAAPGLVVTEHEVVIHGRATAAHTQETC
jgi:hypothetical protein